MDSTRQPVLMVFVDGLGIGPDGPANPVARPGLRVLSLLDKLRRWGPFDVDHFVATRLDATLGVPGIPQSGTGQTTLLTGVNAAELLGRHLNGFPNRRLRQLIAAESVFVQLARCGLLANFANAFTPEFFPALEEERLSVTTWSTLAAGRPLRSLQELRDGRAVYQDFTNLHLQMRGYDIPMRRPEEAGMVLAGMAAFQDFLLYEYFITDFAGHAGDPAFAGHVIDLLDRFLESVLEHADLDRLTVLLTSDHGNIEDLSVKPHTLNPVPLIAWGPGAHAVTHGATSLADVVPAILSWLTRPAIPALPDPEPQ
ncbi:MAG: peptidase [Acidobacteria bacterium]|nr:peptidase [Acidobacteriota bacterium]